MTQSRFVWILLAALMLAGAPASAAEKVFVAEKVSAAEKVSVAVNRLSAGAPLYIAIDRGVFAAEGLDVTLIHLTSSQEIGLAVASGSVQYGMTAITAGIYTLAGKGGLKMIAGGYEEFPGFAGVAIVANKAAYERGLKSAADLAGKKIAITAVGSGSHNQLARLASKYGFKYQDMRLQPLQTLANEVSAVMGGQVDAAPVPATLARQLEDSGAGKIIAWMGDEVPTQFGGVFASPRTIADRRDVTVRFIRAYVAAIAAYDRAFQQRAPDGKPIKGDGYDELIDIIAQRTGEARSALAIALPYFNPLARLEAEDIAEQINVYKSLKLVEPGLDANAVLDKSFVPAGRVP
jgi:NitT/TauT family transport system substrate-binding protein